MSDVAASTEMYQFRVVVRDTSPHLWRRMRVRSSTTLAEFHHTLQVAFGWSGSHPDRFFLRGKAHGTKSPGGQDGVDQLRLADFHFLCIRPVNRELSARVLNLTGRVLITSVCGPAGPGGQTDDCAQGTHHSFLDRCKRPVNPSSCLIDPDR